MLFEDEIKLPYVPPEIVAYLKDVYTPQNLMYSQTFRSSEEQMGYIKGVLNVIDRLESLSKREA